MHLQLETLFKGTSVMLHLREWPIHAQQDSNPWLLVHGAWARPLRHNNSLWSSRPDLDGEAQTVGLEEVDGSRTGTLELVETKLLRQNFGRKFHLRNIFWPTNETLKFFNSNGFYFTGKKFFSSFFAGGDFETERRFRICSIFRFWLGQIEQKIFCINSFFG